MLTFSFVVSLLSLAAVAAAWLKATDARSEADTALRLIRIHTADAAAPADPDEGDDGEFLSAHDDWDGWRGHVDDELDGLQKLVNQHIDVAHGCPAKGDAVAARETADRLHALRSAAGRLDERLTAVEDAITAPAPLRIPRGPSVTVVRIDGRD